MELLEPKETSEKVIELKEINLVGLKTKNEVKRRRKFKNPKIHFTNRNQKNWEEVILNPPLTGIPLREFTETKEWIKDYLECQSFVKEHKSLKRLSKTKKIKT